MRKMILLFAFLMTACAHSPKSKQKLATTSVVQKSKESGSLKIAGALANKKKVPSRESLKASRESLEIAREKSLIQSKGDSLGVTSRVVPQRKQIEVSRVSPISIPTTESKLLAELRDRYDRSDELGFQVRYKAFAHQFPKSVARSEVHYKAGVLELSSKNYGPALRAFQAALGDPASRYKVKALYAKAVTYRRLNLLDTARGLFLEVQKNYPQSSESKYAGVELEKIGSKKK